MEGCFVCIALFAGDASWQAFSELFAKSRFTHVTTLDFSVLTLMAPFWVLNDAEYRKWNKG